MKRALLCAIVAFSICARPAAADRPNVLFIAVDDLKPMLGCYGDTMVKSPQIDRLAAQGTVFWNNQCQQAVCGPSRASLLTGLRPDTTRVYDLKTKMRNINPDVLALPQHFRNNGYETIGMGKIYDPRCVDSQKFADKPSWSVPFEYRYGKAKSVMGYINPETVAMFEAGLTGAEKRPNREDVPNRPPVEGTEDVPDNAYDDGAMADAAVAWIQKLSKTEKPWFLAIGLKKPHLPFVAPKKYWDLYNRSDFKVAEYQKVPVGTPEFTLQPGWELRSGYNVPKQGPLPDDLQLELIHGYHACVSYIDAQVGKMLDALKDYGVAENTIIVLWGDHGWHLGDHSLWCKHTVYEQATRSPLIFSAPGQKAKGAKVMSPSEFTDIFPTLCELAGLEVPKQLEGVSLKPLLDDPTKAVREVAMSQYPRSDKGKDLMGYTFRSERYRYTEWRVAKDKTSKGDGPVYAREFYDYEKDPLETKNLVDDPNCAQEVGRHQSWAAKELRRYGIGAVEIPQAN
jgi:arylsulfatase A-like enzyme